MVQVLTCYHFKSQTVVSPAHEPLVLFTSGCHLFVATSQRTVEVYKLDGCECRLVYTVKTIGVAWKGTFNKTGNYILLLENENGKSNSVRAYFNWEHSDAEENVTKARMADSGSPIHAPRHDSLSACLEVVEVRTRRHVLCVACCAETGNLAAGMKGIISVFRLTGDSTHHDFQHFIDIVVDDFKVTNIDILGAHLAFTSTHEAHVLLLNSQKFHIAVPGVAHGPALLHAPSMAQSTILPCDDSTVLTGSDPDMDRKQEDSDTCFVEDEHFVEWTFGPKSKGPRGHMMDHARTSDRLVLPSVLDEDYVKQKEGPAEVLGPVSGIPGTAPFRVRHAEKTKSGKKSSAEKVPSYIHLLYCRFPQAEAELMSAQLIPTYIQVPFSLEEAASFPSVQTSETSQNRKLLGMCCLFSTPKQGLVYDILGEVRPLSCYLYTGEAISVLAGESFLYAVSSSGLETYSHRFAAAAIHRRENFDGQSTACPDPTTDICLVGLRAFLSVQTVVSCDNHVILMCKAPREDRDVSSSDWSVYVLQKAAIPDLHTEMIELATGFRQASVSAYQHLITEAHLLARARMLRCCHGDSNGVRKGEENECENVKQLYQETSALLGQIYSESLCEEEWSLTVPYLRMSQRSLSEILEKLTGPLDQPYIAEDMSLGPGLASFLDFKLSSDEWQHVQLDEATAERIVDVYCHLKPSRCSELFLSGKVKGHMGVQKQLNCLQKLKELQAQSGYNWSSNDNIAMILVHLELGELEQAKFSTSCLTPDEVTHLIPTSSSLILDDENRLTDFALLLCKEAVDSMVDILLLLLEHKQLALKEACTILKDLNSGSNVCCPLLTRLLESVMCSSKWQHLFPEAMQEVIPIYLCQLLRTDQPSMMNSSRACRRTHAHVPQGDGCFASRFNWLNRLPPFQGSLRQTCTGLEQKARSWRLQRGRSGSVTQPQTPTKQGGVCPCCCCNESLMRLQSLLCSDFLTNEVSVSVIREVEEMKGERGRGSLLLLCQTKLDIKAALSLVIDSYPSVAVEFCSQHCGHNEELWAHVLADLVRGLEAKTTDGMETRKAVSLQMLSGMLGYLVQELEASALLALLPADLPLSLTMAYMERALLRDRAAKLREEVVRAGLDSIATH